MGPSMLNTASDMKQTNSNAMPMRSDSSKGFSKLSFGSDANDAMQTQASMKRVGQLSQVSFGDNKEKLKKISEAADTVEESKRNAADEDESVDLSEESAVQE